MLKNPECKKYIEYSENFQGNLCLQGKLLKNPERKDILIQWKILGQTISSEQAQVGQNSEWYKILILYSEFRAHSVFQGKRKLLKNPEG